MEYYAIAWYDRSYEVVEWDIVAEDAIDDDPRLVPGVIGICDDDDFVDIDLNNARGPETHEDACYVIIAGGFDNIMAAQYFVDSRLLPEEY